MFTELRPGQRIVSVLMYHGLETDPIRLACNSLDITPESCLNEIRFYREQGYRLVSADELDSLSDRTDDLPAYLVVSFDDGHLNTFEHIRSWLTEEEIPIMLAICPEIVEHNEVYWWEEVRARFELMKANSIEVEIDGSSMRFSRQEAYRFEEKCRELPHNSLLSLFGQLRCKTDYLPEDQIRASKYVHENMNWEQICTLAQNHLCILASHSLAHEIATNVPEQELRRNAQRSRQMIREKTGCDTQHYAYPNGIYSEKTDSILLQCGFSHTYSTVGATNLVGGIDIRLNRFHGFGYRSDNVGQFAHMWNQRHASLSR